MPNRASPQQPDPIQELESLSFEQAFQRLQALVASLEQGGLPLDQTTSLYQQGMALVQHCNRLLSQAELKVTELRDSHQALDLDQEETA
jgi:exodeoxyribonuclease VII small subunit